jgi:ferritin-like metal-binding protein YciE
MDIDTLGSLYVDELRDLYSAEQQILRALPKLVKAAAHPELKRAFETHLRQTEMHAERLEQIFTDLGVSPRGKKCVGMEGCLREGSELIAEKPEHDVLDAGLISKAQHVEHYEMAGYGSVRAWAERLGHDRHAAMLQQTLDEERQADQLLTQLAEKTVNLDAARHDGAEQMPVRRGPRKSAGRAAASRSSSSRPSSPRPSSSRPSSSRPSSSRPSSPGPASAR